MKIPVTPAGERLRWLMDHAGEGAFEPAAVADQFEPAFLEQVPLETITGFLAQSAYLRTAPVVDAKEGPNAVAVRLQVEDQPVNIQLIVTEAAPHRIAGLSIAAGPTRVEALDGTPGSTAPVHEVIRGHIAPFAEEQSAGGIVVGVLRGGTRTFEAFGDAPRDGVYDVGSITKPFTGILLAEMVRRGDVALDDPIARHVGVEVPGGITLEQLATHTSGLPRLPAGWEPDDMSDPYASLTEDVLLRGLSNATLATEPGTKSAYSNFGFTVLAYVLSRAADRPYRELLAELVTRPLGLAATAVTAATDGVPAGAVQGHAHGDPVRWWTLLLPGAGGVSSTIDDLLSFAAANLCPDTTPLATALEEAQRPRIDDGDRMRVGLGWATFERKDGTPVVWHNGGTAGFRSFVAIHRPSQTAVAALCNNGDSDPDVAVISALAALLND